VISAFFFVLIFILFPFFKARAMLFTLLFSFSFSFSFLF
jgi:hypothetical protein